MPLLPFQGLHNNLDGLLKVQARHVEIKEYSASYEAVTLVFFNVQQTVLAQNCIYTLSKFAGKKSVTAERCLGNNDVHASVLPSLAHCTLRLVKGAAGVCNYVVVVWDEPSLAACTAMALPCYNATHLIPGGGTIGAEREARLHSRDYNKIT
jgi:hypothetical protein